MSRYDLDPQSVLAIRVLRGKAEAPIRAMLAVALEVALAVSVQALMLIQVSLGYLLLWLKWRGRPCGYESALNIYSDDAPILSVIIPAYREKHTIAATLRRLETTVMRPNLLEVILVDAGGNDGTVEVARQASSGLRHFVVTQSTGGRGPAVAAGARRATGPLLLFVHADTLLPVHFDDKVRDALRKSPASAFKFHVNRHSLGQVRTLLPFLVMELTVRLRSTMLQLPFGDQALGISRQTFIALGGLDDLAAVPILEDFILVQRLRILGFSARITAIREIQGPPAECDGRRWAAKSVWRVNFVNQVVMLLYTYFKYTPSDIFRLYYGQTPPAGPKTSKNG